MINYYGPCLGITLFKWGRRKVELWLCPRHYTIPKHSHNDENIELAFLYGEAEFSRKVWKERFTVRDHLIDKKEKYFVIESKVVSGFGSLTHTFSIPAGTVHWFSVSNKPLIFLNYSKWLPGKKVTSAATDFVLEQTT